MTFVPFFHVGFLVDDLDEAMESFGSAFGVTWAVPDIGTVAAWEKDRGDFELGLRRIAYSKQGPPYVELLQAMETGLYSGSEGMHHIGLWEADPAARQQEFIAKGLMPIHSQLTEEREIIVSYFDPEKMHGVMLELVNENRKPVMEKWWNP